MKRAGGSLTGPPSKVARAGNNEDDRHDETQLDPIKNDWHIFRGPPDYTHVSLPFVYETRRYGVGAANDLNTVDTTFRLTSPYDPLISSINTDINPGTGVTRVAAPLSNAGDTRDKYGQTQFYDFYRGMYQYYSVIACRYKVTIENLSSERIYAHFMHFNQELPPPAASNQDMLLWRGTKSYMMTPHAMFFDDTTANFAEMNGTNIEDEDDMIQDTNANPDAVNNAALWAVSRNRNSAVISHSSQYTPGDFRREIALDSEISTWTSVETNPSYPERLLVRVKSYDDTWHPTAGDALNRNRNLNFIIKVQIEYLTEFRELKAGLRYPTQRNPLSVNIASDNRIH
jgi:hypothetical protein